MPAPRRAPAPATPEPEPTPAEIALATRARLEGAIIAASEDADAKAAALAVALGRRREAIQVYQRAHIFVAPSLLSKLISARSIDAGLGAAGISSLCSLHVSVSARRSWADMARGLFRRHPAAAAEGEHR
jgi:hypothetical protein